MSHFKGPDIAVALPHFRLDTSVLKLLVEALRNNGQSTAMVEGQTGKTASSAELLRLSTGLAEGLRASGVTAGDLVVVACQKSILAYSLMLGAMFSGATAALIPVWECSRIHEFVRGHPVKAVFCDPELLEYVSQSVSQLSQPPSIVATTAAEDPTMAALIKSPKKVKVYEVEDVKKHCPIILFSSGTTGLPKGIQITDVGVQLGGRLITRQFNAFLVTAPISWYTAAVFNFVSSIFYKYPVIISNTKSVTENLQLVEKYKVEGWFANTGFLYKCNDEPSTHLYDKCSLTHVLVGGETVLLSVIETFYKNILGGKGRVDVLYGSTEAGLISTCSQDVLFSGVPVGCCGYLSPGVEIKILDDNHEVVELGCLGEIWIKTPFIMGGYWASPELSRQVFDRDGFFQTGDAGLFDDQGRLYHRGRVGDLINYKGFKISPTEEENLLMTHPEVVEAAIVGTDHPTDGQHMTAFVVKTAGSTLTEQELAAFFDGQVEDRKKLRGGVHFKDSLPRLAGIDKIVRRSLKQ